MLKFSRLLNFFVVLVMVAALFVTSQPVTAQTSIAKNGDQPYVPGQIVIGFAPGKTVAAYSTQATGVARSIRGKVASVGANGTALVTVDAGTDVSAVAASMVGSNGVMFAEPNYIYEIPQDAEEQAVNHDYVIRTTASEDGTQAPTVTGIPVEYLQAMQTYDSNNKIMATYPSDPYLWYNGGWDYVEADIVWQNTTASAGVCIIDTGVDYLHKDLGGKVIKGYDFVNGDADPMDDNGHGTHVAGIIAAVGNNKQGMAGVSTGKVVAVKALDAQGFGTNFDIAQSINYCANRLDVKVINMSLGGGSPSLMIYNALDYAVNVKGKLVVAAAGNDGSDIPSYPAGFSDVSIFPEFENKVISVAASGQYVNVDSDDDGTFDYTYVDYACRAAYSNYGDWVSVIAPGTAIYSTTPWDRPFYLNYYNNVSTRYDSLDGTSMAAPFVAATAARRWGYKPLETNAQVGADIVSTGGSTYDYPGDGSCWPSSMVGKTQTNVAMLLDRGAITAGALDSVTGLPLIGATITAFQYTTPTLLVSRGSSVITASTTKAYPWEADPTRIYTSYPATTDILNLPAGSSYVFKVTKAGYTSGAQPAFAHSYVNTVSAGDTTYVGMTAIPPLSGDFSIALGWNSYYRPEYVVHYLEFGPVDLDLNVWLPDTPNPLDVTQFSTFIVGMEGDAFGYLENDPTGALNAFPFAKLRYEGGWTDGTPFETITIQKRGAHVPLVANAALPYYPGDYTVAVTDYGQTIDHDGDGCGDNYGKGFDPLYDPADNPACDSGTEGIPLMGTYLTPYVYVWKDGIVKLFVDSTAGNGYTPWDAGDACNAHWWNATAISSGLTGAAVYTDLSTCGDADIVPYVASDFTGQMSIYNK